MINEKSQNEFIAFDSAPYKRGQSEVDEAIWTKSLRNLPMNHNHNMKTNIPFVRIRTNIFYSDSLSVVAKKN